MNYRLPLIFSGVSFFLILFISYLDYVIAALNLNIRPDYYIYICFLLNPHLSIFFFLLLLSCLFFNNNKLFILTTKNIILTIVLALIFSVIFVGISWLIFMISFELLVPMLMDPFYENYIDLSIIYSIPIVMTFSWKLPIGGIIFYAMIYFSKRYFDTPLNIENSDQPSSIVFNYNDHKIVSIDGVSELRKLYAIIFSALFCLVTHAVIWNLFFPIFAPMLKYVGIGEITLFLAGILITTFNFIMLYIIGLKTIVRTYQWIPTSSLLTAGAITIVLYGLISIVMNMVLFTYIAVSQSFELLFLFFVLNYVVLYFISSWSLKRYFK